MGRVVRGAVVLVGVGALLVGSPAAGEVVGRAPTTTCASTAPVRGVVVKACVDVTGLQVRTYGVVETVGIAEPPGRPVEFLATVAANVVCGDSLGTRSQALRVWNGVHVVEGPTGVVPCGSTVHATVSLTPGPSGPGGGGNPLPGPVSVSVDVTVED